MSRHLVVAQSPTAGKALASPSLTVIVPVYNTRPYLKAALNSLVSSPKENLEIIIVHDGGTDGALTLAESWVKESPVAATLLDQPNAGLSAARMAGLQLARGDFIAFLDSDDIAVAPVYRRMVDLAVKRDCDIVLCRSAVLDGQTLTLSPFYDGWLWDKIQAGRSLVVTTLLREPRLLRLEPNANPRIIRREFLLRHGLAFEPGLLFEDLPPHIRMLAKANRIGMLGETGYLYRVNRAGKITDERSHRRFDMLRSTELAIAEALEAGVAVDAGANLAGLIARMLYWNGQYISVDERPGYFWQASVVFGEMPLSWAGRYSHYFTSDRRERLVIAALSAKAVEFLMSITSNKRPRPREALRLALDRHGGPVRAELKGIIRHRIALLFGAPLRILQWFGQRLRFA